MSHEPVDEGRLRDAAARAAHAKSGFAALAGRARGNTSRADPAPPSDADGIEAIWTLAESVRHQPRIAQELAALDARLVGAAQAGSRRRRRTGAWVTAGVAAAAVAFIAVALTHPPADVPLTAAYATATGEQRSIRLPDGSVAQLNTDSRLELRYTRGFRSVVLTRGEALFAVVKDAQRPFIVQANEGATRAVGTEFAVESGTESTRVTVLEGRVIVAGRALDDGHRNERAVIPGEAVDYDRGGGVGQPYRGNLARIRAWQAHRILFNDVTLADAILQYNRYATVPIRLDAPLAAGRPVYGTFNIGDQAAFLSALQSALKVVVDRRGASVVIRDAAAKDRD